MTPLPPDIVKALEVLEPQMRAAFLDAMAQVKSAAQLQTIVGYLEAGNIEMAVRVLQASPTAFAQLDKAIMDAYYQGGIMAIAGVGRLRDPFPVAGLYSALTGGTTGQKHGYCSNLPS